MRSPTFGILTVLHFKMMDSRSIVLTCIKSLLLFNHCICTLNLIFFYICELSFNRDFAHCWRAFDMSNKYYLLTYLLTYLTHNGDFHFQFCPFIFSDLWHDTLAYYLFTFVVCATSLALSRWRRNLFPDCSVQILTNYNVIISVSLKYIFQISV